MTTLREWLDEAEQNCWGDHQQLAQTDDMDEDPRVFDAVTCDHCKPLISALRAFDEMHNEVPRPWAEYPSQTTCGYCSYMCHSRSGLACMDYCDDKTYPCPTRVAIEKAYGIGES